MKILRHYDTMLERFERTFVLQACLSLLLQNVAVAAQPAPVPPPIIQSHADCTRPQYASDTLVCGDAELMAIDAEVATLAKTAVPLAAGAIWED